MNIIIPMAGWGTRLRPHTLTVPKPLIKVAGKSVVERLIEEINGSLSEPVTNLVFIIKPEFGKQVEEMLYHSAKKLGIPAHIVYQKEALGTAHAIFQAEKFLDGKVFVAYADTLFKGKIHIDRESDSIILVKKVDNPEQFGVVQLDEKGRIKHFVEKPARFVSDLAIVGIYYFKQGEILRNEIKYLLDNNITKSGEYQLTDALSAMLEKGLIFKPATIDKWMDFGNKKAAVQTNKEILEWEYQHQGNLRGENISLMDTQIIPPCYIGNNVKISGGQIGPYVSIEDGTTIENSRIQNSLIGMNTEIANAVFTDSMIGNYVKINMKDRNPSLNLGDYSKIG